MATTTYRVIDMRTTLVDTIEITVEGARSPEDAVKRALDVDAVRSGQRKDIIARVYWQPLGQPMNMVRLYRRVAA